jgi:hypothetical protein
LAETLALVGLRRGRLVLKGEQAMNDPRDVGKVFTEGCWACGERPDYVEMGVRWCLKHQPRSAVHRADIARAIEKAKEEEAKP